MVLMVLSVPLFAQVGCFSTGAGIVHFSLGSPREQGVRALLIRDPFAQFRVCASCGFLLTAK